MTKPKAAGKRAARRAHGGVQQQEEEAHGAGPRPQRRARQPVRYREEHVEGALAAEPQRRQQPASQARRTAGEGTQQHGAAITHARIEPKHGQEDDVVHNQDMMMGEEEGEWGEEEEEEQEEGEDEYEEWDGEDFDYNRYGPSSLAGGGRKGAKSQARPPKKTKTDPVLSLLPMLQSQLAPDFDRTLAEDTLRELLAQNQGLAHNPTQWLDDALLQLACCQEVQLETVDMRAAMAASLQEAQEARKKQEAEEERESKVVAIRRKYPNSDILAQLSTLVCPALLLSTAAERAVAQLLDLEKNCKKWYPGRGTNTYFTQLASSQVDSFRPHLDQALRDTVGLPAHMPSPVSTATPAPATDAQPGPSSLQRLPVQPVLCCLQPPAACPLCGAQATMPQLVAGQQPRADPQPATGQQAVQQGDGAALAADMRPAVKLEDCPLLLQFLEFLSAQLSAKHAFIQAEVAKMPAAEEPRKKAGRMATDGSGSSGSLSGARAAAAHATLAYVPSIFHVAPDLSKLEVVECFSDSED